MSDVLGSVLKFGSISAATAVSIYACFLGLIANQFFQAHAVYLHAFQMTWFKDLTVPEVFGFLHNQATPFSLKSSDGETLFAWHILPPELYRQHESELLTEPAAGFVHDITARLAFRLLRDDPEAILILHMHGAGGTVGSGYRVPNYRALSAGRPDKIHVLTFDYRGFGRSTGTPTESGLMLDGIAVVEWAIKVAGIPPERILFFAQSMGTAVTSALITHYALESTVFAGTVLVAPFVDVPTLVATYRIAGTIPILGPIAKIPVLFKYLSTFIRDKWLSGDRLAQYVSMNEANSQKYRLTIIHAQDDYDVPWTHTPQMFWRAVSGTGTVPRGLTFDEMESKKAGIRKDRGEGGTVVEWQTENGIIREEILKYGLHDVIMGNPIITLAVMRILDSK
ncbi:hypothetical protein TWF694_006525 [Orbilia ellipsospora]|uniref:AB hydrolase-1 domain-containing protein n=1 Tax=Orbilia ellipsospora TaxID=2528407 RepID=A0AAV9XKQ9_9PEZI